MTMVTSTPPTTPADTSANPGGAASYGAAAAASTPPPGFTAASGVNVFQGLVTPTGNMPTSVPGSLETTQFPEAIPGSPAHTQGFGKGSKAPSLTRFSDLVKLVSALDTGQSLLGFDPQVIADVAKQAHLSDKDVQVLTEGQGSPETGGAIVDLKPIASRAVKVAWADVLNHATSLGINVPADLQTPPNEANVMNKLKALGAVRVEHPTLDALQRNGYNVEGMSNVQSLISGHDATQFSTGAPGTTVTVPGTPAHNGTSSGAQLWDDFVTKWNTNPKTNGTDFRTSMLTNLVAVGAVDLTSGNPTDAEIATAYQGVMQQAATDGVGIAQEFNKLAGSLPTGPGPGGKPVPITSENLDQAYVMHVADMILGPNQITPFQAQTLSNLAAKEGTSSSAAADLINQGIVSLYDPAHPITTGSSFATVAYQTAEDTLKRWGIPATPDLISGLAKQVLQSGINTPYQVTTLAQTAAEGYAKQQATTLYGAGVGAVANAGTDVYTQAQPYLQTASQLLGSPAGELNIADPSGKWMKWSQGGTGAGGTMTQAEWAHYLMTDPAYSYDTSQTAQNEGAQGAQGLLTLFGKLPSGQSNPFGGVTLPSQFGA